MVTLKLDDRKDADRYDIAESFEALDTQKTGRLEFELAYSLLLGLGYFMDYRKQAEFDATMLEEAARRIESLPNENYNNAGFQSGITLETLLKVVDSHPALSKRNRSESFASRCFKLVDRDQKGYITASDVEQLGRDVQRNYATGDKSVQRKKMKLSTDEATEMIEATNTIFAQETTRVTNTKNQHQLQPSVFGRVFEQSFR